MPGIVRSRSSLEDDDDDSPSASPGPSRSTPRHEANKRARLSNEGENVDDSWMLSPPVTVTRQQPSVRRSSDRPPTQTERNSGITTSGASIDHNEFKPGQLVKVHVRNFVTYTNATFLPGPSLNMIIGPNGTGKSTLVCAICIGLGFSTTHLGRAKELSEFVKHGSKDATIEIELKGFPGKTNKTVRLDFLRDGERKQWRIDGQQCRQKDINELIAKFGIQIDNLCHFLPQDRVVEFSRLSAKDRLSSTLRAAAPSRVMKQHDQLKSLAGDRKKVADEQGSKQRTLKQLEERQDTQRGDVERMRERQEVVEDLRMMERLEPMAKHMEARRKFEDAKKDKLSLDADLERLNELMQPFDEGVKKKKSYWDRVAKVVEMRKKLCDQVEKKVNECKKEQEKVSSDLKDVEKKKETETKALNTCKKSVGETHSRISNVESQMQQSPIEIDAADYNRRLNDKTREIRTEQQKMQDIRETAPERSRQISDKQQLIHQKRNELDNLHSESGRQRNRLQKMSQDTFRAWDWIENNQDRFRKPVLGPPLLSCTVKDSRYTPMMESVLGQKDLLRITFTNVEDWKLAQKHLIKDMGLSDISLFNSNTKLEDWARPLTDNDMEQLGLEGWALDFLEGPDDVLVMLCDYARIHTTAIVWQDSFTNEQFKALENSGLSNWVTSKNSYRVTRRKEYGEGAKSTRTVPVQENARFWSSQGLDVSAEASLKREMGELDMEIKELNDIQQNTRQRLDQIQQTIKKLEDEKAELQSEKDEKQRHNSALAALPNRLASLQNKLKELQEHEAEFRATFVEIRQKRETLIMKNGQQAINFVNLIDTLRQKHEELLNATVAMIEAESDHQQLKQQHSDATAERDQKGAQLKQAKDVLKTYKKEALECINKWNTVVSKVPDLQEYFDNLPEEARLRSPDELQREIDSQQARLEMLSGGDPNMIKEFEDRARKIHRLTEDVRSSAEQLQELQQRIRSMREEFEPEVDSLASNISQAFGDLFSRIGCAGSVLVDKPGVAGNDGDGQDDEQTGNNLLDLEEGHDYENWAIQILVKFREEEPLSLLDSHRQSGGERAVTTIYYLMSLQKLSRAPFRVVDEINQGMDPRNERIVHERMVDMSCGSEDDAGERGQYFLITPKLLPNLKYSASMKVHCISSGEFMPEVKKASKRSSDGPPAPEIDFPRLLEKERNRKARARQGLSSGRVESVSA